MLEVRPEVAAMAQAMETQLRAHDDRPGWKNDDSADLYEHLLEEVVELGLAMGFEAAATAQVFALIIEQVVTRSDPVGDILSEAADLNNMSMMCADRRGVLPALPPRPTVVCLCGSTRFWRTFQQASLAETLDARIVLSIGAASGTDDEHFGNLPRADYDRVKTQLDELHLRKIDLCDEVLILNIGGYVGESTARELAYARSLGKVIRWWEPPAEGGT